MASKNFDNPLTFDTITGMFQAILNVLVIVSIPIVVLFIILAGFHYVTAQGNPEKIKDASKALMYGIIGGVVILGASAILSIIEETVKAF